MQKGRDGGLRVGQPKPDNAISAVVYYLNATAAPYADIAAVRAAVELAAIPLAAEMLTEDDAKSLSVLIETQQALVGEASFTSAAMATQKAINHLGGNTILNFYYDALLDSIYLTEQGKQALAKLAKYAEPITASQSAIVDAVLHRDPALARRRVLQHHNIIEKYIAGV
jgi:DNA-binding FadR family transcriptional regulator